MLLLPEMTPKAASLYCLKISLNMYIRWDETALAIVKVIISLGKYYSLFSYFWIKNMSHWHLILNGEVLLVSFSFFQKKFAGIL